MPDPDVTALRTVLVDAMVDWPMPDQEKAAHLRTLDHVVARSQLVDNIEAENRELRAQRHAIHRAAHRLAEATKQAGCAL